MGHKPQGRVVAFANENGRGRARSLLELMRLDAAKCVIFRLSAKRHPR
jgi:hypothetical protein